MSVAADGESLAFEPATLDATAVARVQARVRRRVLWRIGRADAGEDMAGWDHEGGFAVKVLATCALKWRQHAAAMTTATDSSEKHSCLESDLERRAVGQLIRADRNRQKKHGTTKEYRLHPKR